MNCKFLYIAQVMIIISICSCDDRAQRFFDLDTAPKISILNARYFGENENYIIDSLKVGENTSNRQYLFKLMIEDAENNAANIRYEHVAGMGQLNFGNSEINRNEFPLLYNEKSLDLRYQPFTELSVLKIILSDKLGKEDSLFLEIRTFDNLPPIAKLKIEEYQVNSRFEYLIDASNSQDLDTDYGGKIVKYHYKINQKAFVSLDPEAKFIFPGPGNYSIHVAVEDNDAVMSEEVSQVLTIPE